MVRMTPILSSASVTAGFLLYWYANLFLANEPSMISATVPALMQFALRAGFNPLILGMLWGFAAVGKVFVYQSTDGYVYSIVRRSIFGHRIDRTSPGLR